MFNLIEKCKCGSTLSEDNFSELNFNKIYFCVNVKCKFKTSIYVLQSKIVCIYYSNNSIRIEFLCNSKKTIFRCLKTMKVILSLNYLIVDSFHKLFEIDDHKINICLIFQ